jgi:molybdopterin/thiamine biosynthesis adenylyltransferase
MSVFDPNTRISTVTLVGCGGTGGQIARTLARILYNMRERRLSVPTVRLVDPDTVEVRRTVA